MIYKDAEHEVFYKSCLERSRLKDVYRKSLFYCLGIDTSIRAHIERLYDFEDESIKLEGINEAWQTGGSTAVTRLAFNLYSGSTPTICLYEENEEDCLQECSQYAVSDIFSRSICNMEYLMEAVRLRYQSDFENKVKEEIL